MFNRSKSDLTKRLESLFNSIEPGKIYSLSLGKFSVHRTRRYLILDKKMHSEYSYSIFCQCPTTGGVIYHWIAPAWYSNFSLPEIIMGVTSEAGLAA